MLPRRPSRSRATRAWLLVLLAVTIWNVSSRSPATRTRPRDVVLILIDTLRADHVGLYGYDVDTTPGLDRFGRRGAFFAEAWSNAPWTPPSVMSLLTSLEPGVHGLDADASQYATRMPALPAAARTWAEVLRERGYVTWAVTAGGGVGSRYGFARGFQRFYEPTPTPPEDVRAGVERALAWLAEAPRETPLFLFFHTYEVHGPPTHGHAVAGDDAAAAARRAYDADLAFADGELARLLAAVETRLPGAVVVITADHGENLHDRALSAPPVGHGHHLYQELLRVPLIVVAPGLVRAGQRVECAAQLTDVMPTTLALAGVERGGLTWQGRDLSATLRGAADCPAPVALFAAAPLQGASWSAVRTPALTAMLTPPVRGDQWWQRVRLPAQSLFDRLRDPAETADLAQGDAARLEPLLRLLRQRQAHNAALRGRLGPVGSAPASDAAEALRALGYLDAAGAPAPADEPCAPGHGVEYAAPCPRAN